MGEFKVAFWTTYELHTPGDGDPETALKNFIEKNLSEISGHTVSVTQGDQHPNPPAESLSASGDWPIDVADPCNGVTKTFTDLMDWWDNWHSCEANYSKKDANILVTNYAGTGGVTGGSCDGATIRCVAEGSDVGLLANEPFDSKGCSSSSDKKYSQMYATVLHELGHAISTGDCGGGAITNCSCNGNEWEDELAGYSYYDSSTGNNFTSPMVTWRWNTDAGKNECCTTLDSQDSKGFECFERPYSQCRKDWSAPC